MGPEGTSGRGVGATGIVLRRERLERSGEWPLVPLDSDVGYAMRNCIGVASGTHHRR
jgi:hypothetical protein